MRVPRVVAISLAVATASCAPGDEEGRSTRRDGLTVAWHITATGLVSRSSVVSSSMKYLPVEDCIAKAVRTWVFQNPNAVEADATWGFQFTPP